jgi:hypothetical protein
MPCWHSCRWRSSSGQGDRVRFHRVGSSRPGRRGRPPRATLPPRMRRRTGTAAHRDRGLRRSCPSEATKRIGVGHRGTRRGDARIARRSRFSSFPIRARAISKHFRCPGGPACSILFPSCSRQLDRGDFGDAGSRHEGAGARPQPSPTPMRFAEMPSAGVTCPHPSRPVPSAQGRPATDLCVKV